MLKRDNSATNAKVFARQRVAEGLGADARILECFCGAGLMYEMCWSSFSRGATIDTKDGAVEQAARERPTWAVYQGDAEKCLLGGWMSHVPFDLVDIDAYGSPWPFLLAWASSDRARAPQTRFILTDGYASRAAAPSSGCRALFGGSSPGNLSHQDYLAEVKARLSSWGESCHLAFEGARTVYGPSRRMAIHTFMAVDTPGNVDRRASHRQSPDEVHPIA